MVGDGGDGGDGDGEMASLLNLKVLAWKQTLYSDSKSVRALEEDIPNAKSCCLDEILVGNISCSEYCF
jgi:hypothetical protein